MGVSLRDRILVVGKEKGALQQDWGSGMTYSATQRFFEDGFSRFFGPRVFSRGKRGQEGNRLQGKRADGAKGNVVAEICGCGGGEGREMPKSCQRQSKNSGRITLAING